MNPNWIAIFDCPYWNLTIISTFSSASKMLSQATSSCHLLLDMVALDDKVLNMCQFHGIWVHVSMHLRHCSALTISTFRWLWHLLIVIPADENTHSLQVDTEDAIISKMSAANDAPTSSPCELSRWLMRRAIHSSSSIRTMQWPHYHPNVEWGGATNWKW